MDHEPHWDVAISFAGHDREPAREVVRRLGDRGLSVYYDETARAWSVGHNLFEHLMQVYKRQARCCIVLISEYYSSGKYTKFELTAAQERELEDEGYLIPVRLDDTEMPSLPTSTGYARFDELDAVVERVLEQVRLPASTSPARSDVGELGTRRTPSRSEGARSVRAETPSMRPESLPAFERVTNSAIIEIREADLVARCVDLSGQDDPWIRWRLARDLARHLAFDHGFGPIGTSYSCWRVGEYLYLSLLPTVLGTRHQTLEFKLADHSVFLVAIWWSDDPIWTRIDYDEWHDTVAGLMLDRPGLDPMREGTLLVLRERGVRWGFPVTARSDAPEDLGEWRREEPETIPFDWDRNPRLGDRRFGVWVEAHHVDGAVLIVFMLYGAWSNASLYDLRESLAALLPHRVDLTMLGPGAMRVAVMLMHSSVGSPAVVDVRPAERARDALYLCLARAAAVANDHPIPPIDTALTLPRLEWSGESAFVTAVEALGMREYPQVSDAWWPTAGIEWLKPRHTLNLQGDLVPRFDWGQCSLPAKLRTYIESLEASIAV